MSLDLIEVERKLVNNIMEKTKFGNLHNISRTVCYADFYERNKEIRWAFLASMVSRNAGWSMTDLETNVFRQLLPMHHRNILFLTYERANWLIFSDAYPQLLIYEASKTMGKPMFHLLQHFNVSKFMIEEWERFWTKRNVDRLVISQIINEQHVIEEPVINHPFYKKEVFRSLSFKIQDLFHFSVVLFPTITGKIYGFSVHDFTDVRERVRVGRNLYWLLFYAKEKEDFHHFSRLTEHTGSRLDYEKYKRDVIRVTPKLLDTYPIISHHRSDMTDWYEEMKDLSFFYKKMSRPKKYDLSKWFKKKHFELSLLATIQHKIANAGK